MTETFLTDDDVAALEALESGNSLTDDQVGRLQALENTPFFAESIKQSESASQRFTGAGFADDGSYVSADPTSPIVQVQPESVPPAQGPLRGKDESAPQQQPIDDGMQFNLVAPPPMYVEERETNIRGPRLGAMGPSMESGDFYANDEELLDALRSAPAQGRVLTSEEHRTMLELEEKESDKLGALKSGAGMMAAGLWEMAKGMAVEQGITVPGAIGQALSSAVFDPANAASILKQGMIEASKRAVQGEVTKAEGMRRGYIGMRQIWSWLSGLIENDQIATDQRQAVMTDLRQAGAFGADNVANAQLVEAEIAKRREQGMAPFAPTDRTQEFETKYQRYLENEKLNRAYTGQNQYLMGEQVVNERPGIIADQLVTGFNPITGQPVEPLPYTSMGYGMFWQPDTYVGFGAGYLSKARVVSRAAAAARPLFSVAEKTALKAAEVAKTGRDAHKFLTMSNIASGGALATGAGMQFNQSTGDLGKALMFFGALKPTMRAAGFVFKKVPGGSKVMEAAGVFRPQSLRIIAEESKAGPLGAGSTAQTPATQAAAIRAARPEAAQRLVSRGGVPDRYARFMGARTTRSGDVKIKAPGARGFDSTLKRVAQNPENPPNVRRAARAADEIGLTQAFRTTDDAISGALAGLVGSSPFAAIAPDDQTAGGILAVGTAFGAAGGIAGGVTSFKGDAVDADIARFMVDTEAFGGDPVALFQIPRKDLAALASLQSMSVNKGVDFVALRTEDYLLNVPEAKGTQGYFATSTAKDGSKPRRMRLFVDLGHSVVQEGGIAKVVKADDGMYELTVVRPDGKVMYPAPASDGSQPVIRRKSPNDFTVRDGDPVSPYVPLNRQSPRVVASAHEFMHALMNSDMFGGDHQGALRSMVYNQYKPEKIAAMAREYAQRIVDAQINNGAIPKPTNEESKAKLIDDMITELSDDSVSKFGDQRAWVADEILSESWQDIAQTTDINRMRQGKSPDGRLTDAARSVMIATTRALETFGMKFDWATGKPLTNPSTIFRDNPLANSPLIRKRILEAVRNYDRYLTLLEDAGAVESKGSPLPRSGKAEDWLAEGTMRTHDVGGGIKENDVMVVDPDGQVRWKLQDQIDREHESRKTAIGNMLKRLGTRKVGANDPTFGLRDAGPMRTIYSGAELPMENSALGYPPVLAAFPKWYREMYMDTILPALRSGETVRFSNNTVGTRGDKGGPYKLRQLISSGFAKQSEGVLYGMQITKSGNHINLETVDLNSFKAAALKAINNGKLSHFNNDYKEVVAGLKQYMDNHRNKRDGSYMLGPEGKNIINGLLYGKSRANDGYGAMLNPRGSIRTYRMDRMNWMERTGDTGYFFDNDRVKNNRMPETDPVDGPNNNRMPQALPREAMGMPDVAPSGRGQAMPDITITPAEARRRGLVGPVYHGSPDFKGRKFDPKYRARSSGLSRGGFSFSDDVASADGYASAPIDSAQAAVDSANDVMREAAGRMERGLKIKGFSAPDELPEFNVRYVDDISELSSYFNELAKDMPKDIAARLRDAAKQVNEPANPVVVEAYLRNPKTMDIDGKKLWLVENPDDIFVSAARPPQGAATGRTRGQAMPDVADAGDQGVAMPKGTVTQLTNTARKALPKLPQGAKSVPKLVIKRIEKSDIVVDGGNPKSWKDYADQHLMPLPNIKLDKVKGVSFSKQDIYDVAQTDRARAQANAQQSVQAAAMAAADPLKFVDPVGYSEIMRASGVVGDILIPPSGLKLMLTDPAAFVGLLDGGFHGKRTVPGTRAAAMQGLDGVTEMRQLVGGQPSSFNTALHHFWGTLSKQLDVINQEAAWMRLVLDPAIIEAIDLSINGNFSILQKDWEALVTKALDGTQGDFRSKGNNAKSNANSFYKALVYHNGRWDEVAALYANNNAIDMRAQFNALGHGKVGMKNKVQGFVGLSFGIKGSVLDRWRFVDLYLPDVMSLTGASTPEQYFKYVGAQKVIPQDPIGIYKNYGTLENGNPAFSLALYNSLDSVAQVAINNSPELRNYLGAHADPGGLHWVTWNSIKNEAVGHSSLDITKNFVRQYGRNGTASDFAKFMRTAEGFVEGSNDAGQTIRLSLKNGVFSYSEQ